jgi:hypothetical protein
MNTNTADAGSAAVNSQTEARRCAGQAMTRCWPAWPAAAARITAPADRIR